MTDEQEQNLALASYIAEKIFSMDYHSAQLRLIHTAPLREGQFDADTLKIIAKHLLEVEHIASQLKVQIAKLTPTITPASAPEKQTEK